MKLFVVPSIEIVHFESGDVLTNSCPTDCTCVECLPCAEGDHCTYYDTCPTYCARDKE